MSSPYTWVDEQTIQRLFQEIWGGYLGGIRDDVGVFGRHFGKETWRKIRGQNAHRNRKRDYSKYLLSIVLHLKKEPPAPRHPPRAPERWFIIPLDIQEHLSKQNPCIFWIGCVLNTNGVIYFTTRAYAEFERPPSPNVCRGFRLGFWPPPKNRQFYWATGTEKYSVHCFSDKENKLHLGRWIVYSVTFSGNVGGRF